MTPLVKAARDLLEHETQVAQQSWRQWNGHHYVWNDQIWAREDPEQFELVKALRKAIAEAAR